MRWTIHPQTRNGATIGLLSQARGRKFDFLLNRPSEARFELPLDVPDVIRDQFRAGRSEFVVRRDGEAVETVFAFTNANVSTGDGDAPSLACAGLGIACYLQDASIYGQDAQFTGTTLPWTWINTFQARTGAAYGITSGTVSGTPPTRYKTVQQDAELMATIISLAESGAGFDFGVDQLRRWREWHPTRGSNRWLELEWGVNVLEFQYEENAGPGQLVNAVRATGPTDGPAPKTSTNTTSATLYGRREAAISYMADLEVGVTDSQLQSYADAATTEHAYPQVIPGVKLDTTHPSVHWGAYDLGDTVRFQANLAGYVEIDAYYRIVGIHVDVDDNENEDVSLTLNKVNT